jgi:hypothetical protein
MLSATAVEITLEYPLQGAEIKAPFGDGQNQPAAHQSFRHMFAF